MLSSKTYLVCGDSYYTDGILQEDEETNEKIDLNDFPSCSGFSYPTEYYYLVYNDNNVGNTEKVCLYDEVGSDGKVNSKCKKSSDYTLKAFTRTHYLFSNWNTQKNGSGVSISSGVKSSSVIKKEDVNKETINIYAQWIHHVYNLTYDYSGGVKGTKAPVSGEYDTVLEISTPTKTGYTFTGWTITSGLVSSVAKYGASSTAVTTSITSATQLVNSNYFKNLTNVLNGTVTLKANWKANNYTITYDGQGVSISPTSKTVTYDGTYGTLPTPTRNEYIFLGWYLTNTYTSSSLVTAESIVKITSNRTLYAKWELEKIKYYTLSNKYKCSNITVGTEPYLLEYTGTCALYDDGNGNWKVKLLSSGSLTLSKNTKADVFIVGGGGGGGGACGSGENGCYSSGWADAGGGGYTTNVRNVNIVKNTSNAITVANGGGPSGNGGTSSAFGYNASGGISGTSRSCRSCGGSGGGSGNEIYGTAGSSDGGGAGQVTTTREFAEPTGDLYSGGGAGGTGGGNWYCRYMPGGAGGGGNANSGRGGTNTGGGGAGAGVGGCTNVPCASGGSGGTGVVVIRNSRFELTNAINATKSDTQIAYLGGRLYKKSGTATALSSIYYTGSYTGPIIITNVLNGAGYIWGSTTVNAGNVITSPEGRTLYYTSASGFMSGNLLSSASSNLGLQKLSSSAISLSTAATEMAKKWDEWQKSLN